MSRFSVATPLGMFCVVALATAGCRVYDTQLVQKGLSVGVGSAGSSAHVDTVSVADTTDAGAAPRVLPVCGNGRLDDAERCDVAIAQDAPGACPDDCAQEGCFMRHLEGTRCGARCVATEITEPIADDGCCPNGATPATDSDCSPTCGNGKLDGSETCDPPERCPEQAGCKTELTCMSARYTGSRETCSARCELLPIVTCAGGDGCCPPGCTQREDGDCPVGDRKPPRATGAATGASGAAGMGPSAGAGPQASAGSTADPSCTGDCQTEPSATRCLQVHSAGVSCQACDCAYCADQFLKCEDLGSDADKTACQNLIQCATRNRCSGLDCYCGAASASVCASGFANGPCAWEVRQVAGAFDIISIFLQAAAAEGPLPFAASALACRGQHCRRACGL